jgi:hypothetical protein
MAEPLNETLTILVIEDDAGDFGLVKAYLRLGARACGEPCRDPDFGVADVLILLRVADLNPVYARHFIERLGGA